MKKPLPQLSGIFSQLIANIRALLPDSWRGHAGDRFRKTVREISEFAERHRLYPSDLADEAVSLGRRKVEGLASKEFAAAVKDFADAERIKIEAELRRRSLKSEVEKIKEDERLEQIRRIVAEVDLIRKLKAIGAVLRQDEDGNWTALPMPGGAILDELITSKEAQRLQAAAHVEVPERKRGTRKNRTSRKKRT